MIKDILLKNFRSYKSEVYEFGESVNIIVGPNASGKTNLLEAVLMISRGSSYRATVSEVIAFNEPWARIEAELEGGKRVLTIEQKDSSVEKKFTINNIVYKRLLLNKTIPIVVFEPDHLRLLSGGPERRRDYLDSLLEQTIPGFSKLRREYARTLAQRNRLLKLNARKDDFFVWDVRLSELGGKIAQYRVQLIDVLNKDIGQLYQKLSQSDTQVALTYKSSCDPSIYGTQMLNKLGTKLQEDILKGFTSLGPHRDDLLVTINDHPAAVAASRGEVRTILLTLKILELKILEENRNTKPLLLLDDVFSELDGARRKALTSYLKDYQTFITTTDADIVVQHFMEECTIIPLGTS